MLIDRRGIHAAAMRIKGDSRSYTKVQWPWEIHADLSKAELHRRQYLNGTGKRGEGLAEEGPHKGGEDMAAVQQGIVQGGNIAAWHFNATFF